MQLFRTSRRSTLRAAVAAAVLAVAAPLALAGPAAADPANAFVTGKITGNGRPLAGVVVSAVIVLNVGDVPGLDVEATTTTAADGTYRLVTPAFTDAYRIRFDTSGATGGTSPTGYTDRCYGGTDDCRYGGTDLHLVAGRAYRGVNVVAPRAAALQGRVVDTLGRGVGGFAVSLFRGAGNLGDPEGPYADAAVSTDVNGNYRFARRSAGDFAVCFGSWQLDGAGQPAPDGYSGRCDSARVTLTAGAVATRNATVRGAGAVRGRVVDPSGAPVAGATVVVTDPAAPFFVVPASAVTSTAGTFLVHGVTAGAAQYCVNAPRFENTCTAARSPEVTVRPFRTSSIGTFVLRRAS